MKKLAIIGSSGGNLHGLGGNQPEKLLSEIITQASSCGIEVSDIVFVAAAESMDSIKQTTDSALFTIVDGEIAKSDALPLKETNKNAKTFDKQLAKKIAAGEIDGVIVVSADPKGVNNASLKACAEKSVPAVGTGGTSMAYVSQMGVNVISVSGTTGTTNRTRAVSAITTFAKLFDIKYMPIIGSTKNSKSSTKLKDRISIKGIMLASIPGFIAMSIVLALSQIPALASLGDIFNLLVGVLPIMVAAIAAKQVSDLDEIGIIAGIVAGVLSTEGGVIGGIVGGILAGILASYLIRKAIEFKIPGTTANIIAGGLAGLAAGLFVYYLIAPICLLFGNGIRDAIDITLEFSPALAGLVAGLLIWPAIIAGVYHAAILPIVLIEMEAYGMSFLGSVDMVGLVMVSAGITLANIVFPRRKSDRAIAVPGFTVNMAFGTFVEASYPFMFSNKWVMATAIISSGIGGLFVGMFGVKGTAYLPSFVAPALSNEPLYFALSMIIGLVCAFVLTALANKFTKEKVED